MNRKSPLVQTSATAACLDPLLRPCSHSSTSARRLTLCKWPVVHINIKYIFEPIQSKYLKYRLPSSAIRRAVLYPARRVRKARFSHTRRVTVPTHLRVMTPELSAGTAHSPTRDIVVLRFMQAPPVSSMLAV
eukprot:gene8785-biopygen6152